MVADTVTSPVLAGHVGTVAADAACATKNVTVSATTTAQRAVNRPTCRLIRGCIATSLLLARTIDWLGKRIPTRAEGMPLGRSTQRVSRGVIGPFQAEPPSAPAHRGR